MKCPCSIDKIYFISQKKLWCKNTTIFLYSKIFTKKIDSSPPTSAKQIGVQITVKTANTALQMLD